MSGVRVAGAGDVAAVAAALGASDSTVGAALASPLWRILVGPPGVAAVMRFGWSLDTGEAEAEVLRAAGPVDDLAAALRHQAAMAGCAMLTDRHRHREDLTAGQAAMPLEQRFLHRAALASARAHATVGRLTGVGAAIQKADGSLALDADAAADEHASEQFADLGVALLSEEDKDPTHRPAAGDAWIVVDPIDGTGNYRAGLPPYAFSAGLVVAGEARAGYIGDLSSGRRWWGAAGSGAYRDGQPVSPQAGATIMVPTPPEGQAAVVPPGWRRLRITGCTAIDLCLVADGSAGAWHDLDRAGTHVHDVAGALGVVTAAGAAVLDPHGSPLVLEPDTETLIRFVVAANTEEAERLRAAFTAGGGR